MPEATMEGKSTFGCLVNGEVWLPKGYAGYSNLDLSYDPYYAGGALGLSAYRILNDTETQFMYIYSINVIGDGVYDLSSPDVGAATFSYVKCGYDRDSTVYREGKLTITRFDLKNQIISGTFEFSLAKPGCDTIKVTQGRFDMKI